MARPIKHRHKYRYDESLNKWIRKKRYKHPVITVVKLDPDQALLVVCKAGGGGYFNLNNTVCLSGGLRQCPNSVRGRRGTGTRNHSASAFPS